LAALLKVQTAASGVTSTASPEGKGEGKGDGKREGMGKLKKKGKSRGEGQGSFIKGRGLGEEEILNGKTEGATG